MNIQDFVAPPPPPTWSDVLNMIFVRQRELMDQYKTIEGLPDPPLSLHHAHGQRILKDFAWRAVEELAESWEAHVKRRQTSDAIAIEQHTEHQREELADALHFLVELMIFAGVTASAALEVVPIYPTPDHDGTVEEHQLAYWRATYHLGIAMNFLRNKPWKQSQVPTDEGRFREQLLMAFQAHVYLWADVGLDDAAMHAYYFRKSEVNKFRQRSQY